MKGFYSATALVALLLAGCADQKPTSPGQAEEDSRLGSLAAGNEPDRFGSLSSSLQPGGATVHVPKDYATIQAAVNAAGAYGMVFVHAGTYAEKVIISHSGLRLHAAGKAILDGTGLKGAGIHILGTAGQPVEGVEVSGFEVRNFERGIVVQFGRSVTIHGNEIHHNVDKVPPLLIGDASGIYFAPAFSSEATGNDVHNNGDVGILIEAGSTDNVVKVNLFHENGIQLAQPTAMRGRGVGLTGAGTTRNVVEENRIDRNWGRGIFVVRPPGTTPISGNRVERNHLEGNQRSGISVMFAAGGNFFIQNDARGNNLSNLAPCFKCNLFDATTFGNTWEKNKGTFNLTDVCQN